MRAKIFAYMILTLSLTAFIGCGGGGGSSSSSTPSKEQNSGSTNTGTNTETNAGTNTNTDTNTNNTTESLPSHSSSIIIDHKTDRLGSIPERWINEAKKKLHIAYQGASHSRQMTRGMKRLMDLKPINLNGYRGDVYNVDLTGAASTNMLDLHENFAKPYMRWGTDLSNKRDFDKPTIEYLDDPRYADVNVIFWMWCWQRKEWNNATSGNQIDIQRYLDTMEKLIAMYGENGTKIKNGTRKVPVTFVFTTGPNQVNDPKFAENENKWVFEANNKIREHVKKNGRILFDFYDLESYDPDENYFGDGDVKLPNVYDRYTHTHNLSDDNNYNKPDGTRGNWAKEYQATHAENVFWFQAPAEHSDPVDANAKTYAMWWLFARLAGWDGR